MSIIHNIMVRDFVVDPGLVGMAAIDATGRRKFVEDTMVEAMPRATVTSGKILFFRFPQVALKQGEPTTLAKIIGLQIVDPHTLAAFMAANPDFDNERDVATEWNMDGKWCYEAFSKRIGGHGVLVRQRDRSWAKGWWFAGMLVERAA